jgi:hypothetical protein
MKDHGSKTVIFHPCFVPTRSEALCGLASPCFAVCGSKLTDKRPSEPSEGGSRVSESISVHFSEPIFRFLALLAEPN